MAEYRIQVAEVGETEYRDLNVTLPGGLWEAVCDETRGCPLAPSDILAALVDAGLTEMHKSDPSKQLTRAVAYEQRNARHNFERRRFGEQE